MRWRHEDFTIPWLDDCSADSTVTTFRKYLLCYVVNCFYLLFLFIFFGRRRQDEEGDCVLYGIGHETYEEPSRIIFHV